MKLPRTTLILVAIALLLGGFVVIYETQTQSNSEVAETGQSIFDFEESEIQFLRVERGSEILEFERTGESPQPWQMIQPENTTASNAAVVFLLNLLAEGQYNQSFSVASETQLQEYGLDNPWGKVTVRLANQSTHEMIVGQPSFDERFIYAQTNPPTETVLLVPVNFQYAVEREMEQWKAENEPTVE